MTASTLIHLECPECGGKFDSSFHMDEILSFILDTTMQALQAEAATLALVEPGGTLAFCAAAGTHSKNIIDKKILPGQGVAGWVASTGQGLIIPNAGEDKRYLVEKDRIDGNGAHALACAPIVAQGNIIGILEAINPITGTFNPDALRVLTGIANLAGPTIQHAQLFQLLQSAHKRYRELFDNSIDPVIITDWNGRILEANRQAAILSAYTPEQLQSMPIGDLHQADWSEKGASLERLKSGQTCDYESVLKSRIGRQIPIRVYVRRVGFEEPESLQWTLRDITERKDLDKLRGDLTAMIYHDLQSPQAMIASSLDVLTHMFKDKENGTVQDILAIARHSTDRIQRLTSSLLDTSRLESGQRMLSQQAASPVELARQAVEAVRPMAERRNQTLKTDLPIGLPSAWVDVDMIQRVLINLLENASKFTPTEGRIKVGAKADGEWVQFWVQDNGPGIPVKTKAHIFEKYTRLKGKENPAGQGVGLAFCQLAISSHGGKIWVESKPGHGSRFILTLPAVKKD